MEKKKINLATWKRKVHLEFFTQFDEPFFGITAEVDCKKALKEAKRIETSFFLYYLHKSLCAANDIPEFRYRIEGGEVFDYERIDASPTIGRPNETFGFSYMRFDKNYLSFEKEAKQEIEAVSKGNELHTPNTGKIHVIHYSSLPWIKFTALKHAQHMKSGDSVPKISFGKVTEENGKKKMPVSVFAHHALVDGLHVGKYLERFQDYLNGD